MPERGRMFQEDDDWKKIVDRNGDFITPFCESVPTPDDITVESCSHEGATASLTDASHVEEEPCLRTTSTATRYTHPSAVIADENIQDTCLASFNAEEAKDMTTDDLAVAMERALLLGSQTDSRAPEEATNHASDISWIRRLQFGKMIGCGSHGQVYVVDLDGQTYAAKILRACSRQEAMHLSSEAKLNLKFSHDNIVTTYKCVAISHERTSLAGKLNRDCVNDVSCEMWILQELCAAGSLHTALEDQLFEVGTVEEKEKLVCSVALDIARGLEYLHSQDIIHGD